MRNIILTIPFLFAFIFVTGVLVYLNSTYQNIFQFDFSPRTDKKVLFARDSLAIRDSLILVDSLLAVNEKIKQDSLEELEMASRNIIENVDLKKDKEYQQNQKSTNNIVRSNRDSSYNVWLKKTIKLVENMPPSQASKLLKNYSDNEARDIIII
jgi:hypothetical protein